ncbi:helix-turn-helix domain-containing protein [Ruegeria sp. HKCCE3926]|uniref:AraC family transcriptional regulator n=1 Tax=unclassified Ruegeria TaxID=2625375 RepID=UPI00149156E9|nr:helix-turn-helix domain-containing protein [Ruegeria sp. HKCCD7559]
MDRNLDAIDELNEAAVDAGFDCSYLQLDQGYLKASSRSIQVGQVGLVREVVDRSVEYRGVMFADTLTFMSVLEGENARIAGLPGGSAYLWFVPSGFHLSMVTGGYIDVVTISVPREVLLPHVPSASPAGNIFSINEPAALRLPEKNAENLKSTLAACFSSESNFAIAGELQTLIVEDIVNILRKVRIGRGVASDRNFKQHDRLIKASDFIAENLHRPVSISELTEVTATSERTLLRHFKAHYGLSPNQYARIKRLEEVRRSLKSQRGRHGAITKAAMDFGFSHLGRFAAEFQTHFGVLPSVVVGKAVGTEGSPQGCG